MMEAAALGDVALGEPWADRGLHIKSTAMSMNTQSQDGDLYLQFELSGNMPLNAQSQDGDLKEAETTLSGAPVMDQIDSTGSLQWRERWAEDSTVSSTWTEGTF